MPGHGDGPPFVYTVGLSGFAHPGLILFATSPATAATVLNQLGELVRAGRRLRAGELVEVPSGGMHLVAFPDSDEWLPAAGALYRMPDRPPVPALLVMPVDDRGAILGEDHPREFCP